MAPGPTPKPRKKPRRTRTGRGAGKPQHEPTKENRGSVKALKAFGATNEGIARYLNINHKTLIKYYFEEIEHGREQTEMFIGLTLIQVATGNGDLSKAVPRLLEFLARVHLRWRTADPPQGENGGDNPAGMVETVVIEGGLPEVPYTPIAAPSEAAPDKSAAELAAEALHVARKDDDPPTDAS